MKFYMKKSNRMLLIMAFTVDNLWYPLDPLKFWLLLILLQSSKSAGKPFQSLLLESLSCCSDPRNTPLPRNIFPPRNTFHLFWSPEHSSPPRNMLAYLIHIIVLFFDITIKCLSSKYFKIRPKKGWHQDSNHHPSTHHTMMLTTMLHWLVDIVFKSL